MANPIGEKLGELIFSVRMAKTSHGTMRFDIINDDYRESMAVSKED